MFVVKGGPLEVWRNLSVHFIFDISDRSIAHPILFNTTRTHSRAFSAQLFGPVARSILRAAEQQSPPLKVSWGRSTRTAVCRADLWWGISPRRTWCVRRWTTASARTARCRPSSLRCRPSPRRHPPTTVGDRTSTGDVGGPSAGSVWRCRPAVRRRDVPASPTPRRTYSGAAGRRRPPLSTHVHRYHGQLFRYTQDSCLVIKVKSIFTLNLKLTIILPQTISEPKSKL